MCFWCGAAAYNIIHPFHDHPKHLAKENIKEGYIFMKNGYTDYKIFPKD